MQRKSLGRYGEQLARTYLERLGRHILHTNWRYGRYGEVDIIAYCPERCRLCFVEVKTRTGNTFGETVEAITPKQQQTLHRLAEIYLSQHSLEAGTRPVQEISFDLVMITPSPDYSQPPQLTMIESAF